MDPLDRDQVVAALEANLRHFERIVARLDEVAAVQRPAPERWSPLEVLEHVAVVERAVHKAIAAAGGAGATELRTRQHDTTVAGLATLARKLTAPDPTSPKHRFGTIAETLAILRERRTITLDLARSLDVAWEAHHYPHPFLGPIDIGQWLLLAATHGERHALQMEAC